MGNDDKSLRKNASGYSDPTAYKAIVRADKHNYYRFKSLLNSIFKLCEAAGFQVEGRIVLKDKKTGIVWR